MVQQNYFSDLYPARISDLSAKPILSVYYLTKTSLLDSRNDGFRVSLLPTFG